MDAIRSVLREELQNAKRLQKDYEALLRKLPKGSMIKKRIKGHEYYYLVYREGGIVRFDYKGKASPDELAKYKKAKADRARYRPLLAKVRKEQQYLERILRARRPV